MQIMAEQGVAEWLALADRHDPRTIPFYIRKTRPGGNLRRILYAEIAAGTNNGLLVHTPFGSPFMHPADWGSPRSIAQTVEKGESRPFRKDQWTGPDVQILIPDARELPSYQFDKHGFVFQNHIDLTYPLAPWRLEVKKSIAWLTDLVRQHKYSVDDVIGYLPDGVTYGIDVPDLDLDVAVHPRPLHPRAEKLRRAQQIRSVPEKGSHFSYVKDREQTRELCRNWELGHASPAVFRWLHKEAQQIMRKKDKEAPHFGQPKLDYPTLTQARVNGLEIPDGFAALPTIIQYRADEDPDHAVKDLDIARGDVSRLPERARELLATNLHYSTPKVTSETPYAIEKAESTIRLCGPPK